MYLSFIFGFNLVGPDCKQKQTLFSNLCCIFCIVFSCVWGLGFVACVTEPYNKVFSTILIMKTLLITVITFLCLSQLCFSSVDIFSYLWRAFLFQEAFQFNLVRRGIVLLKFQLIWVKRGLFLHHICYSGEENVCLSSHFKGEN